MSSKRCSSCVNSVLKFSFCFKIYVIDLFPVFIMFSVNSSITEKPKSKQLTELSNQLQEQQDEIIRLKHLVQKQNDVSSHLKGVIAHKNKKIGRLQTSLRNLKQPKYNSLDAQVQVDNNSDHYRIGNCGAVKCVSSERVRMIHSYALPSVESPSRKVHKCVKCGFSTNKKSTLTSHHIFCLPNITRALPCPVCKKSFTYDTLRTHLNHYATGKHKPMNGHENYSPIEHKVLLESIKVQRLHQKK